MIKVCKYFDTTYLPLVQKYAEPTQPTFEKNR